MSVSRKTPPTNEQLKTTEKAVKLRHLTSDKAFADELGVTKATLYSKLRLSNWNKLETFYINLKTAENEKQESNTPD